MRLAAALSLIIAIAAGLAVPAQASAAPRDLTAYRGLGSWIDIYDTAAWNHPVLTVQALQAHGVQTVFVETGNSSQAVALVHPTQLTALIRSAHVRHMKVVAWYLPTLIDLQKDRMRGVAAIHFTTSDHQRFDSFALDIESSAVKNIVTRNERLATLSHTLRLAAGQTYPLGAIIPAPRGMQLSPTYWPNFPYRPLTVMFDLMLPMDYYTNRVSGAVAAQQYTEQNAQIVWQETGRPDYPIHMIGGGAEASNRYEVRGFVKGVTGLGLLGGSLYDAATTRAAEWDELQPLRALR